ncbi:MAG: hypothetical protein HKP16_07970 [Xanthomonadales bacterium]|nr:hypothetical protein [Xanthomonadales bacterium]
MNRKNLTAAVLAGLAGAAGLAGTAQAVNLNPDGLGQVLIYPYFTTNDGNQTVLSVVNTTDQAKAVKVRFLEGYNSREVLDFNLYLSAWDVWVAGIADGGDLGFASQAGVPHLVIPDTSCTVPYLYGNGIDAGLDFGLQAFLPYAYSGSNNDGGPDESVGGPLPRAAEGYFQMIEMGTLVNADTAYAATKDWPARPGAADAATHVATPDGPMPLDCNVLVENWTGYGGAKPHPVAGVWYDEALVGGDQASSDTRRNSGGLFGGAAVINPANGTMFSYDAKAIQGYDKTSDGVHFRPGNEKPSLDSGNQNTATVFFGVPQNKAVTLSYGSGVDAVSAAFMHDNMMNTYTVEEDLNAASEYVFTFPTKSFYVDPAIVGVSRVCEPDPNDQLGCEGWEPGDPFPNIINPDDLTVDCEWDESDPLYIDFATCDIAEYLFDNVRPPFTDPFDGQACEVANVEHWDREESPSTPGTPGDDPPIVSPPPPPGTTPPGPAPFALCYEVNRLDVGGGDIFGETDLLSTTDLGNESGWVRLNFSYNVDLKDGLGKFERRQDRNGMVGLPVTGFTAEQYENGFLAGGSVLANYGGLFQHKASVRRIAPNCEYHDTCKDGD